MEEKGSVWDIPKAIFSERKLIVNLAKNDFRTKFAGSYFGIFWAFIQPVITVFVYWFVFEKALNAGTQSTKAGIAMPYVLWLIAGLIPWFYFTDVITSGTHALIDYSYLVKKVVFNISILPVVKAVSAVFVHLFFIVFMLVMYSVFGFYPSIYMVQVLYYSFALMILSIGIIYLTSAAVVFFRDLSQLVNIALQIGIWFTPIMWNIDAMNLSPTIVGILKANPLFYIVAGYRDAMFGEMWFWEHPKLTAYYWIVTLIIFLLGTTVFRRLKIHFADVL